MLKDGEAASAVSRGELPCIAKESVDSRLENSSGTGTDVLTATTAESILDSWTWRQQPDSEQLKDALQSLLVDQRQLAWEASGTMPSMQRLQKRLTILSRYFLALSRHLPVVVSTVKLGAKQKKRNQVNAKSSLHTTATDNVTQRLAKVGTRAILSFMFSSLKRTWRSGEDIHMCSDILQESLSAMLALPVASLFDETSISAFWVEVVSSCWKFLRAVVMRYSQLSPIDNCN